MDSIKVLDYQENMKRLMLKLLIYMYDRWRSVVLKKRDVKKRVVFLDFVIFIKNEVKKFNDLIYGNILVNEF